MDNNFKLPLEFASKRKKLEAFDGLPKFSWDEIVYQPGSNWSRLIWRGFYYPVSDNKNACRLNSGCKKALEI